MNENPESYIPETEPADPAQKPRDSIFKYAVVLFSVAFILVLLSYFAQERARHGQELADEAAAVMTVRQTLDHITRENERLTARISELELFLDSFQGEFTESDPSRDPSLAQALADNERYIQELADLRGTVDPVINSLLYLLYISQPDPSSDPIRFRSYLQMVHSFDAFFFHDIHVMYEAYQAALDAFEATP
jgi:hypothetical protein